MTKTFQQFLIIKAPMIKRAKQKSRVLSTAAFLLLYSSPFYDYFLNQCITVHFS
jgi:hypothetical protein